jgi:aspartyl-tRNA(Asn)/glutamyl-tRNA(Gln) amidotransferase subunit B
LKFKPEAILELVNLVDAKTISSSAAQQVFAEMFETGKAPAAIVQEKGLAQVSDTGAIEKFCDEAIAPNPGPANDFKSGKTAALNLPSWNFWQDRFWQISLGQDDSHSLHTLSKNGVACD